MIKLSRKMEYAFIALKYILGKKANELTTAKEISTHKNIPFDVTSRVLQIMTREKILQSNQGVLGGYKIIQDLNTISLYQLSEMIEGPQGIVKCLNSEDPTTHNCELWNSCEVHSPLKKINQKVLDSFKTIMISEIVYEETESQTNPTQNETTP